MNAYSLPTSLNVGGVDFNIRTDFRDILQILLACNDPEVPDEAKTVIMIIILYEDYHSIPPECIEEAAKKACEFIDCGQSDDGKHHPKLIDWKQDAQIIIPAINKVANKEVRAVPYMHWWTFFSYFMEIGESLLGTVITYRSNRAKGKKKEKWEIEFYKENKKLIDFQTYGERSDEEKKELRALFGFAPAQK